MHSFILFAQKSYQIAYRTINKYASRMSYDKMITKTSILLFEEISNIVISNCRCVNREYGYYGDPDDPQKYFVCLPYTKQRHGKSLGGKLGLGRKWEFTCGPGTIFSEKHLTCV